MSYYRCYFMDFEDHIVAFEVLDHCVSDTQAQQAAVSMLKERRRYKGVSVWDQARKVFEKLLPGIWLLGASVTDTLDAIGMLNGFGATLVS